MKSGNSGIFKKMNIPSIALENGLNLKEVTTTGSVLHINKDYEDTYLETVKEDTISFDFIGQPVKSFEDLEKNLFPVDEEGLVKKKIIEGGGGLPLNEEYTVSIAFSGYWENEEFPFDVVKDNKPLDVDLKENGLLPGFQIALQSMLVGELSVFLFSYKVMYGELGIPPRIKPKAKCVFYIKLIKSVITPKKRALNFSEPNMFERIHHEVKLLYSSGMTLHKTKNYTAAMQVFRKIISMLHKCRLSDENEERIQEKLLIKLYTNLAVCYNKVKKPLSACLACNELCRLNCLWNNSKVLFQNAKALRMIGEFDSAEKKIRRALQLSPDNDEIKAELDLLWKTRDLFNQSNLIDREKTSIELVNDNFKQEVNSLIKNFKNNVNLCKLTLPDGLKSDEIDYIKEVCVKENLILNTKQKSYLLDKDLITTESNDDELLEKYSFLNSDEESL